VLYSFFTRLQKAEAEFASVARNVRYGARHQDEQRQQPTPMTPKQFRMKRAGHTDTPSGLDAAFRRGRKLGESGAGELALNEALSRCMSPDSRRQLSDGYNAALAARYNLKN
jgi:hypothetical protein